MIFDDDTIYGPCTMCGAVQTGGWPHPLGMPCPQKVLIDDAYIEMLHAQRDSFERMKPPSFTDLFSVWKR